MLKIREKPHIFRGTHATMLKKWQKCDGKKWVEAGLGGRGSAGLRSAGGAVLDEPVFHEQKKTEDLKRQ